MLGVARARFRLRCCFVSFHQLEQPGPPLRLFTRSSTTASASGVTSEPMQSAEKREKCYAARDAYFECKVKRGVEDCAAPLVAYEAECPKSWREFFNRQQERHLVLEGQADMARARRGDQVPPQASPS
jgi:hypothetical protein